MTSQRRLLERYLDELDTWNRRLNLTTVPREQAWERHVEESLRLLAVAGLTTGSVCVDIGSGGGVPGLVVAVVRPDLRLTLLDSDRRKCGFLMHVSGLLELGNVTVVCRRAEHLGDDPAHRQAYDVAVSRAAAPPPLLCRLALPLLRPGGRLWALVGEAEPALALARASAEQAGGAISSPAPGIISVLRGGG